MAPRPRPAPGPKQAAPIVNPVTGDVMSPRVDQGDAPAVPIESLPPEVAELDDKMQQLSAPLPDNVVLSVVPAEPEFDIVRALWYGDPGVGKTTAMCTLANLGPIVLWDAENRMKPRALRRAGINIDNIERIGPEQITYEGMKTTLDGLVERDGLVGVCFDGGTEMLRLLVADAVDTGVIAASRKGFERAEWKTYVEDYGDVAEQFRRLLRRVMRLECHFGMTTAARRGEDEAKKLRLSPDLTAAIARDVYSAMDVITYVRVDDAGPDGTLRSGLVAPGSQFDAKDTFGVLPRRLANPTFERILAYVNEDLSRDTDPEQEAAAQAIARNQQEDK